MKLEALNAKVELLNRPPEGPNSNSRGIGEGGSRRVSEPHPISNLNGSRSNVVNAGKAGHLLRGREEESIENSRVESSIRRRNNVGAHRQSENNENRHLHFSGSYETPKRENGNEISGIIPEPFSEISNVRLVVSPSQGIGMGTELNYPSRLAFSVPRRSGESSFYICQESQNLDDRYAL